jgi:hypothetical protein
VVTIAGRAIKGDGEGSGNGEKANVPVKCPECQAVGQLKAPGSVSWKKQRSGRWTMQLYGQMPCGDDCYGGKNHLYTPSQTIYKDEWLAGK